ncbi:hypothetical protein [Pelagicoccus sp. SDUM812002]|uniref:hypothetical protein n=1 Tax=Pelagicoccus sp. SDUM812002 TaxID=3041266 RepID=UPI00280C551C|nr:hypothetical protein [Pelagicoccus sp. SDUM812002]MDQ8185977.1 hypothetical protein [Pelagicoccus sp. SDUM812002]
MPILIAGLVAAAILLLLPRFLGRRQQRMLEQYHVLEKRFGLSLRVSQSRWGKGIGEHHSLHGESRGYPLSLYSHFVKKEKDKLEWTSLVFEALFAESVEFCIEFKGTDDLARFEISEACGSQMEGEGFVISASEDLSKIWRDESVAKRFPFLARQPSSGAIRLSKGFLEYRETGMMEFEEQRLRFQEAILFLASICDALSLYMSERKVARSAEL